MFSRELEIKKSSGAFIAKGMFYLLMLLLSVFCCLSSWIFYIDEKYTTYITAVGFISTLYFTYLFTYTIYRGLRPKNALVLTEKGVYDFVNDPGKGIFVNWENISSVKIFGSEKAPLLGIELYDSDILLESLKKNIAEEIRSNIQAGLPAIVIRHSDLGPSLPQVLPAFNEFISLTRPIPTVKDSPSVKNSTTAKNAPMSQKISDETTDDSIFVVADEIKPVATPIANVNIDNEMEDIFVLPPEPKNVFDSDAIVPDDISIAEAYSKTPVTPEKKEKPSFDGFKFESEDSNESDEINFTCTKEMPTVKVPDETIEFEPPAVEAVKEEPQPATKKEIKTLEELLSQFSVPTNKNKKQ
jgi:hypothetical protein